MTNLGPCPNMPPPSDAELLLKIKASFVNGDEELPDWIDGKDPCYNEEEYFDYEQDPVCGRDCYPPWPGWSGLRCIGGHVTQL